LCYLYWRILARCCSVIRGCKFWCYPVRYLPSLKRYLAYPSIWIH